MDRMSPELWNRIPPEAQAVFVQMAETIARLEHKVAELEARVNKTPQNSSLPPSTQHPHAKPAPQKEKSGKKRGGQPGHPKHERPLIPTEQCQSVVPLKPKRAAVVASACRQRSGAVAASSLGISRNSADGHGISASSVDLSVLSRDHLCPIAPGVPRVRPDHGWWP